MGTAQGYRGYVMTVLGLYMVMGFRVPIRGPTVPKV